MDEMKEAILEYVIDEYVDEDDDDEVGFDTPLISSRIVDMGRRTRSVVGLLLGLGEDVGHEGTISHSGRYQHRQRQHGAHQPSWGRR